MIKKKLLLFVLCSMLILPAAADEINGDIVLDETDTLEFPAGTPEESRRVQPSLKTVSVPKWEEFCESGYEDAKLRPNKNIFNIINFVDAEQDKSNYWAERRINFEKAMEHCNTLTAEEKGYCYEGVRNAELERNEMYEQQRKQINYKNRGILIDKPNY